MFEAMDFPRRQDRKITEVKKIVCLSNKVSM